MASSTSPRTVEAISALVTADVATRQRVWSAMTVQERSQLLADCFTFFGTSYVLWQGAPEWFVHHILGEAIWSGQQRLLNSLVDWHETAVPSAFSTGKTRSAALAVAYWAAVYPPGTAVVVTLAPRWRQVIRQVWPEVRRLVTRAGLPGTVDQAQWRIPDQHGLEHVVAYGIAAAPHSEDAVQGIHSPNLLLVVDEAGGIAPKIGRNLMGLLTGSNSRMLAIGNPATDDEQTWFENLCRKDRVNVIQLAAKSTPNFTGEPTAQCRSCPSSTPPHPLAKHLITPDQVADAVTDYGPDSRYVIAKVNADFPHGGPGTLIPASWVQAACDADEPATGLQLCDLTVGEDRQWLVAPGAWVRLGVDVAADGGDEVVISRAVGDLLTIEHTSAGAANANAVDVAGRVLEHILAAQLLAKAVGSPMPVRVKVDVIGVGWGVVSLLETWAAEGRHQAEIVRVDVREATRRAPDAATLRPARKRDELWLAMRALLTPDVEGLARIRLRADRHTQAQLSAPRYTTDATGHTVVESKDSMRRRGVRSPDRAEAVCLAVYEPIVRRARLVV